jgi:thioredoxin-like negative regulator of GroEL
MPRLERVTGVLMVSAGLVLLAPPLYRSLSAAASASVTPAQEENTASEPRIVAIISERCPICERLKPQLEQLRADCAGRNLDVVEVGSRQAPDVRVVPTIRLYASDGSQVSELIGERSLTELRAAAATLMGKPCAGQDPGQNLPARSGGAACGAADAPAPEAAGECAAAPDA